MPAYTVAGLWVEDEPVVAIVLEGDHPAIDNDPHDGRFQGRWATVVDADGVDEAEREGIATMLATLDE